MNPRSSAAAPRDRSPPTNASGSKSLGPLVRRAPLRQRGFALLITLTLLAFMVLLLVGLATYTRVETAIAGNSQRQAQARENALFALQVALGQLQKNAGPDTRVTATAEAVDGVNAQRRHYTGVWDATAADSTPVWLASGLETGAAINVTSAVANGVTLVGPATDGTAFAANGNPGPNNTVAALQNLTAPGVPGTTGAPVIGRYAWWVGDQGVKAPVAVPDTSSSVTYPPFDSTEIRSRIRQQIAIGAGAADTAGAPVFEPRDNNNANLVASQKIAAASQFAFLRNPANAQLGLATVRQRFHDWSPDNFAVLANTKLGGLRQDLSLKPTLLGGGFAAWADYTANLEPAASPAADSSSAPVAPPELLRRRYVMKAPTTTDGATVSVAPVLSHFLLGFNVRSANQSAADSVPLQVRAHWAVSLWNPYTSALVPETKLRLEIENLPTIQIDDEEQVRGNAVARVSLPTLFGSPLVISLPWDAGVSSSSSAASSGPLDDRASWLPGRVYSWVSAPNSTGTAPGKSGYESVFYSRNLNADSGEGVVVDVPGSPLVNGDHINDVHDFTASRTLTLKLYAERADGDVLLGTFTSPAFERFTTTQQKFSQNSYQFAYVFRLKEGTEDPQWLATDGRDFRSGALDSPAFAYEASVANPENPASFYDYRTISSPDRLLDREANAYSYNEDTPLFELPRAPLLSVGSLQHLALPDRRPFAIGNPWSGATQLNGVPVAELFDRYFFSGLATGVSPSIVGGSLLLPNPRQKVLRDPVGGAAATEADLRGAGDAQSSKFLLQGSAFNLNSVSVAAWAAVLRGVRFPAPQSFVYLDASPDTGTAPDSATQALQTSDAAFLRFAQSAQETYKAEPGLAGGSDPSAANTHLFRRGLRVLSAAEVSSLAARIVALVRTKLAAADGGGPFRSLAEFLAPSPLFAATDADGNPLAARSLLEAAIADAGINSAIAEFSSQWLTQADVMTALAPVLFPRSDTFVVRAYGEAVNPATNATEGRAWCEALVQRLPEYFDSSQPAETAPADLNALNQANGRRFKIVSFRWLTRSDI